MKRLTRLFSLIAILILAACARMGSPDGGAFDETPPQLLRSNPAIGALGNKERRIVLEFDEYVKLEKAAEKVVISPPQVEMPEIKTSGKRVIVELLDTLQPETTYSIDFGDAIVDNNEGNPLGQFTFTFSTGEQIDSMEVSGTVLDAQNLEPVKGMQVGLHRVNEEDPTIDTAFTTRPFDRVGRTDSRGRFALRGVAPGCYRIYGLMDSNQDYIFNQKSEAVAFLDTLIVPSSMPATRMDTLWIDTLTIDTIREVPYTRYLPDDVVLLSFKEEATTRYLIKQERLTPQKFSFYFSAPADSLPVIKGLNFDETAAFIVENSAKNDTVHYWIPDSALYNRDTLEMAVTYLYTDTLGLLVPRTDTINLASKKTRAMIEKERARELEDFQKDLKKRRRRLKEGEVLTDTLPPIKFLKPKVGSIRDVSSILYIDFDEPLARIDTAAIHLTHKVDTLWVDIPYIFEQVPGQLRRYRLLAEWRPEQDYELRIDSVAFTGLYGLHSDKMKVSMKMASLDTYGTLALDIRGGHLSPGAYVELLNGQDSPVRRAPIEDGRAEFFFLKPGTYYARLIDDANGNGKWDTGLYADRLQPERVFYYPHKMEIRALWDMRQDWDVEALPLIKQKPADITKQKPDSEKKRTNKNEERAKRKRNG